MKAADFLKTQTIGPTALQSSVCKYLSSIGAIDLTQRKGLTPLKRIELMRLAMQRATGPIAYFWRNNVGWGRGGPNGEGRVMAFGLPGSGDIVLKRRDLGTTIHFETKAGTGRLSPLQREFQRLCQAYSEEYVVIRSVDDAVQYLKKNAGPS